MLKTLSIFHVFQTPASLPRKIMNTTQKAVNKPYYTDCPPSLSSGLWYRAMGLFVDLKHLGLANTLSNNSQTTNTTVSSSSEEFVSQHSSRPLPWHSVNLSSFTVQPWWIHELEFKRLSKYSNSLMLQLSILLIHWVPAQMPFIMCECDWILVYHAFMIINMSIYI